MDVQKVAVLTRQLAKLQLGSRVLAVQRVLGDVEIGFIEPNLVVAELQDGVGLTIDQALDVFDVAYDDFVRPFISRQPENEFVPIRDRFETWREVAARHTQPLVSQAQHPSLSFSLEQALSAKDTWRVFAILEVLAKSGRLVSLVLQNRSIREGFSKWLNSSLASRSGTSVNFTIPVAESWDAPLLALLLEYLLQVQLGWAHEEAALGAMALGQYVAAATNDHRYATAVYGDEATGEFRWRPVRLENGAVVFAD